MNWNKELKCLLITSYYSKMSVLNESVNFTTYKLEDHRLKYIVHKY